MKGIKGMKTKNSNWFTSESFVFCSYPLYPFHPFLFLLSVLSGESFLVNCGEV